MPMLLWLFWFLLHLMDSSCFPWSEFIFFPSTSCFSWSFFFRSSLNCSSWSSDFFLPFFYFHLLTISILTSISWWPLHWFILGSLIFFLTRFLISSYFPRSRSSPSYISILSNFYLVQISNYYQNILLPILSLSWYFLFVLPPNGLSLTNQSSLSWCHNPHLAANSLVH